MHGGKSNNAVYYTALLLSSILLVQLAIILWCEKFYDVREKWHVLCCLRKMAYSQTGTGWSCTKTIILHSKCHVQVVIICTDERLSKNSIFLISGHRVRAESIRRGLRV